MIPGTKVKRHPSRYTEEWMYWCRRADVPHDGIFTVEKIYNASDIGLKEIELGWGWGYFIVVPNVIEEEYI